MAITIIPDFIPEGAPNRGGPMVPKYLTLHDTANPNVGANAEMHGKYMRGPEAARREVSWHFTVDDKEIRQHLPLDVNGWHASDGYGPGNTQSIAIEICENADGDRAKAEANAAMLCAYLIKNVSSLLPYPSCMKQHHDFARDKKNCPHIIRGRTGGWEAFLLKVSDLMGPLPWNPADEIARLMARGIINSPHEPADVVRWSEMATIVNRVLDRMDK